MYCLDKRVGGREAHVIFEKGSVLEVIVTLHHLASAYQEE